MTNALAHLLDAAQRSAAFVLSQVAGQQVGNRDRMEHVRRLNQDALVTGVVAQGVAAGWTAETCEVRALAVRDAALAMLNWQQTIQPGACAETYVCRLNDTLHAAIVAAERIVPHTMPPAPAAIAQSPSGRVKLFDGQRATVDDVRVPCKPAQFAVLKALLEAGRPLRPKELDKQASKTDAGKHLRRLRIDHPVWKDAIVIPGGKGGSFDIP